MKRNKSRLQKSAYYFAAISAIGSLVCSVYLYLKVHGEGWNDPIAASFIAGVIFFVSIGTVFFVIASTNLPSFKPGQVKADPGLD